MGVLALKSNVKNKIHKNLVQEQNAIKNFFVKKNKTNTESSMEKNQNMPSDSFEDVVQTQVPSKHTQGTNPFTFQDGGKLNAEMRWVLKHVFSEYNDNSVTDSVNIFKVIFPDSKIASMIDLGKDKLIRKYEKLGNKKE